MKNQILEERKGGFPPLDPPYSRILVLGSFPSLESLVRREYYGHPRNHFWPILAAAAGESVPADWPRKVELAKRLGVSIWDMVAECEREGSLDAAIRKAVPNAIAAFVADRPSIRLVILNGSFAARLFESFVAPGCGIAKAAIGSRIGISLGGRRLEAVRLPSTSPVPTKAFRGIGDKLPYWTVALRLFVVAKSPKLQ